ncbi:MAG TPA: ABC transporter substrate-binding protein [Desulfomicrobiaceae bacterium]|nr:ABC transporter substrate-binding protein [Desulfomicrobiaceae bacterium]
MRCFHMFLLCCLLAASPCSAASPSEKGESLSIALSTSPGGIITAALPGILATLVGTQVFAGLVRPVSSPGEGIAPYLASSWNWSATNNAVTFELRPEARFHDGTSVTAADVAFSIATARKHHPYGPAFSLIREVQTDSPHRVTVRFTHPVPPQLIALFSANFVPILPRHVYAGGPPLARRSISEIPVGSGPFRMQSIVENRTFTLQRFNDFFLKGRPYLSTLVFTVYDDLNAMPLALQAGDIDLVSFLPSVTQHEKLRRTADIEVSHEGYTALGSKAFLAFNLDRPPFDDIRVRRALNHAVDRAFIVSNILRGDSVELHGPLLPTSLFYTQGADVVYDYDIQEANRLLDAAGYPRGQDGKRFRIHVSPLPNARTIFIPVLEFLRHSLARSIGVEVTFDDATNLSAWREKVATGRFEAVLDMRFLWSDPIIGMHRTYHSENIQPGKLWANMSRYRNAEVDALLEQAAGTIGIDARRKLYARVQTLVTRDAPAVYLGSMPYATAYRKKNGKILAGLGHGRWGLLGPLDHVRWE